MSKANNNNKRNKMVSDLHSLLTQTLISEVGGVSGDTRKFVTTGLDLLDYILGGGYPVGQYTQIVGHPGSAKSTLVCLACKMLEEKYKENALNIYIDTEQSMSIERLRQLGVNKVSLINGVTIEQVIAYIEKIASFKFEYKIEEPSIFVWDTYANTISAKELDKVDDPNKTVGWRARLLSFWIPKLLPKLSEANLAVIVINQLRDKISQTMGAAPTTLKHLTYNKTIPGGNALLFNSYTLIELKDRGSLEPTYGFPGEIIEVKTVKCKSFPTPIRAELVLDFRTGFSNFWTNVRLLKSNKKLIGSAASIKLANYPDKSTRLRNLEDVYNKDPKFRQIFDQTVQDTLQELYSELSSSYVIVPTELMDKVNKEKQTSDITQDNNQTQSITEEEYNNMTNNKLDILVEPAHTTMNSSAQMEMINTDTDDFVNAEDIAKHKEKEETKEGNTETNTFEN